MKKIKLELVGIDSWDRPVYKDGDGHLFKDTNLGIGIPSLCTVCGGFEGEPNTPVHFMDKYKEIMFVLNNEVEGSL